MRRGPRLSFQAELESRPSAASSCKPQMRSGRTASFSSTRIEGQRTPYSWKTCVLWRLRVSPARLRRPQVWLAQALAARRPPCSLRARHASGHRTDCGQERFKTLVLANDQRRITVKVLWEAARVQTE